MEALPTLPTYLFEPNLRGLLSFFLAVLLPVVVGFVTRPSTPAKYKGLALLGLAAVKSVVEAFLAGDPGFNLATTVYTVVLNFGIAVLIHYGLYRHTRTAVVVQHSGVKD